MSSKIDENKFYYSFRDHIKNNEFLRFLVNPNTRRGSIFALSIKKDDNFICLLLVFLSGKQEIDMTHYRRSWLKVLYVFVLIISLNCSTHKLHIYVHGTFSCCLFYLFLLGDRKLGVELAFPFVLVPLIPAGLWAFTDFDLCFFLSTCDTCNL